MTTPRRATEADGRHGDPAAPVPPGGTSSATGAEPAGSATTEPGSTGPRSAQPGDTEPGAEDALRRRLGLRPRGHRLHPTARLWGWVGPLLVTALAAVLRLVNLEHPGHLVFDETYYVKQAYSLLVLGYEGRWADDVDPAFAAGDTSGLSTDPDYVVHPQVGKWMIAIGLRLLGADDATGWRISAALTGTLAVLLLSRVAVRLFRSPLLGSVAGLLLAVDGMHLTASRISLLDGFLTFWVLVGFWAVLRDRESSRAHLAREAAAEPAGTGGLRGRLGPGAGPRWWLVAAGVALGLATGVKWSGLYAVAVLGILVLCWDTAARRTVGARRWVAGGVLRGGVPAFVALVPTAAVTYLAGWFSWFATPGAYLRTWAADQRAAGEVIQPGVPDALASWWEYHRRMFDFHTGLASEHSYEAHPAGWLVQWRPTSFYWPEDPPQDCGAERCVEAITSLGNPVLWWLAAAALLVVGWTAVRRRDWRSWAILAGYGAMYVPWFAYTERTIFTFYAVAFTPYVVLALTYGLGWVTGVLKPPGTAAPSPPRGRRWFVHQDGDVAPGPAGWWVLTVVVAVVLLVSAFFWPVWTGQSVSYGFWHAHMWLASWV
ncbi:phospholipid carrier-dependent glycosyltransferase [Georgenia sp. 10Sc9-8]|uniref:Polyprenol-phosphate-mannose--protein mannosyltransferase n=1 Tax=Georgenia halotolerans TaxID=3028317 RepID=A0ABT5U182_9MICO|nr:phospholipid carrier-dependent glycosyltransferase [Georgenia halotolerans]